LLISNGSTFTFLKRIWWGGTVQQLTPESPADLPAPCPWLLRDQIGRLGKFLSFHDLTNFMLKWIWCGYEGSYDDFCLWDI